jgi:pyrroloquinoline-quinone synthase
MPKSDLTIRIHRMIESRSLLKHPFYRAWSLGTLPMESLRQYAAQYYHFELAYPTFLSGVHHRCNDRGLRQLILENLWDEEHGPDNHVELWLRFCDALGLSRDFVQESRVMPTTDMLIETYRRLTTRGTPAAGAAALYAFESQVPEIAKAKIRGLQTFYGLRDARSVSFFSVHQALDQEHSAVEREMVLSLAKTEEEQEEILDAVAESTLALWQFLDRIYS